MQVKLYMLQKTGKSTLLILGLKLPRVPKFTLGGKKFPYTAKQTKNRYLATPPVQSSTL